jgi:hypothetical protein
VQAMLWRERGNTQMNVSGALHKNVNKGVKP